MESVLEISASFRSELARRDPSAMQWLDDLPDLWRTLSTEWSMVAVGPARTGATSLVVPVVTRSGIRAALKLVSPVASMESEASALRAFGGRGAVALLDADVDRRALLLEWVDGPALLETDDVAAAMSIAGRLSRELAEATPPSGAPRLAEQAPGWLEQLHAQHGRALQNGTALPDRHLEAASEIIRHLSSDATATLTHGDLSLSNILQPASGRWVAVDPSLLVGTAANEAHTVVRSRLTAVLEAEEPLVLLREWTRRFAEAADVDPSWAQALSFARYLSSYYWESQNGGDPAAVAGLRQASLLSHRLL